MKGSCYDGHHSGQNNARRTSAIPILQELEQIIAPLDEAERILSLQLALKCSDLSHTTASLLVHLKWVSGLENEFFCQGDREKEVGLPVSPLFDRSKLGVTKSQVGFFDIVGERP